MAYPFAHTIYKHRPAFFVLHRSNACLMTLTTYNFDNRHRSSKRYNCTTIRNPASTSELGTESGPPKTPRRPPKKPGRAQKASPSTTEGQPRGPRNSSGNVSRSARTRRDPVWENPHNTVVSTSPRASHKGLPSSWSNRKQLYDYMDICIRTITKCHFS